MTISGPLPPAGGPSRAAQAYGVAPRRAPAAPAAPAADKGDRSSDLRAVLSDDERAYFDQIAALGPITYGPNRKPGMVPAAPRGLRLDVRG